jgi:hypothetical protein
MKANNLIFALSLSMLRKTPLLLTILSIPAEDVKDEWNEEVLATL